MDKPKSAQQNNAAASVTARVSQFVWTHFHVCLFVNNTSFEECNYTYLLSMLNEKVCRKIWELGLIETEVFLGRVVDPCCQNNVRPKWEKLFPNDRSPGNEANEHCSIQRQLILWVHFLRWQTIPPPTHICVGMKNEVPYILYSLISSLFGL